MYCTQMMKLLILILLVKSKILHGQTTFGGKSFILIGDPGQLPPVSDKPLYHSKPSNPIAEQGHRTYRMFDKVVKLTVSQRVQSDCIKQQQFRNLLSRLRIGNQILMTGSYY